MINNKLKLIIGAFVIFAMTTFTSCDKVEELEVGGTSVQEISGDWWIIGLFPDETVAYGGDYQQFSTYNTAADDGTLFIDDHANFFEIKTKVNTNLDALTFSGDLDALEMITGGTVTVTNGKFTKESYTTASNTTVDEIYFEAEFDWDPGTVYIFKGHKRTGFAEDENPHY